MQKTLPPMTRRKPGEAPRQPLLTLAELSRITGVPVKSLRGRSSMTPALQRPDPALTSRGINYYPRHDLLAWCERRYGDRMKEQA